jgi:hypothetical protein
MPRRTEPHSRLTPANPAPPSHPVDPAGQIDHQVEFRRTPLGPKPHQPSVALESQTLMRTVKRCLTDTVPRAAILLFAQPHPTTHKRYYIVLIAATRECFP